MNNATRGCDFVLANQDTATILGVTDAYSDICFSMFFIFLDSRFPDTAGTNGQTLRSQSDFSPDAPRIQMRRKEPGALAAMKRSMLGLKDVGKLAMRFGSQGFPHPRTKACFYEQ